MDQFLSVGKLPHDLLSHLLARAPIHDTRLLLGPGVGLDCAIIDYGETALVLKSDPITFTTHEIGWYAVQVNANDIATTGATPRWLLVTVLLPGKETTEDLVERISNQIFNACEEIGVALIGGHTEITHGLDRPILMATLIGEVARKNLITPRGAIPGDRLLLTKGVPIEATAILAREFSERLLSNLNHSTLSITELEQAQGFLYRPGISVLHEARLAVQAGQVHAMHDPTEGGIYTALWELAEACGHSLSIDLSTIPVPELSQRICQIFGLDPLGAMASGALLLAVPASETSRIIRNIQASHINCVEIGQVIDILGSPTVYSEASGNKKPIPRPDRDEIAKLFE